MRSLLAFLSFWLAACPFPAGAAGDYAELARLANDWRHFEQPTINHCVPDYGASAMAAKADGLPAYRARLRAIDSQGWSAAQKVDRRLIEAEMNGLDFDLRVRRPWARDPSLYATVFGERSDVPQHEGVTAAPSIDLFAYDVRQPDYSRQQEAAGKPFNLADFFAHMNESGTIPFSLIETEMVDSPMQIGYRSPQE